MHSRPSYVRAALANQYNVILLAGSVSFSAALASWAPLLSGLVGEVLWLAAGPRLGAFRRRTDERHERASQERAMRRLGPEYAPQIEALRSVLADIERLCAARPDLSSDERDGVCQRLWPLLSAFLQSCASHQRLRAVAAQGTLAELESELSSLHGSLAAETDLGVRASLRRALTVAERRIKQLEGNEAACRSLELALQIMQKSVAYVKEQAAGLGSASDICMELEAAAAQLGRAAAFEAAGDDEVTGRSGVRPPPLAN